MSDKRPADDLTVEELQQLLYRKKRLQRRQRLQRLAESGRVVVVDRLNPPNPEPPPLIRPQVTPTGALREFTMETAVTDEVEAEDEGERPSLQ
ncbi:MAG: hypothetical protein P8183_24025, partial [Anaerolineae bacterium]